MHHMPLLKKSGISDEGIETVRTVIPHYKGELEEKGLDGRLWAVLRYTDAMTKDVKVPDEVFANIQRILDDRQVVELSKHVPSICLKDADCSALTIAGYNAVSRFLLALDVAEMKDVNVGDAKLPSKL